MDEVLAKNLADKLVFALRTGVTINRRAYEKAEAYANAFKKNFPGVPGKELEFLIYLCRPMDGNNMVLTDVFYPKQIVSHASVNVNEDWSSVFAAGLMPVSIFHSHDTYHAFQSPVDLDTLAGFVRVVGHMNYIPLYGERHLRGATLEKQPSRISGAGGSGAYLSADIDAEFIRINTNLHDNETAEDVRRFYELVQRSKISHLASYVPVGYSVVVDDYGRASFAARFHYRCSTCGPTKFPEEIISKIQPTISAMHEPGGGNTCEFNSNKTALVLQRSDQDMLKKIDGGSATIDVQQIEREIRSKTEVK